MAPTLASAGSETDLSDSPERFSYDPLDRNKPTIRVIQILPGSEDTICCTLKHVERQEDGHVCLSYHWGDESNCHEILVNGKLLTVRSNLWDFLQLARKLGIQDWLWIDAICLDQGNIDERNHQVQYAMKLIYSSAKHVLIYPGPFSPKAKIASKLALTFGMNENPWKRLPTVVILMAWNSMLRCLFRTSILMLCYSPYWSRMWICQEILLAKRCYVVSDSNLIEANKIRAMHIYQWNFPGLEYRLRPHSFTTDSPLEYMTFESVFRQFWDMECTEKRDRIYGLLGLASDAEGFTVDYRRPTGALALDVLEHFVPKDGMPTMRLRHFIELLEYALEVTVEPLCSDCAPPHEAKARAQAQLSRSHDVLLVLRTTDILSRRLKFTHYSMQCKSCNKLLPREGDVSFWRHWIPLVRVEKHMLYLGTYPEPCQ